MKIRTDFVTNSSSSSFILEIEVLLKVGEAITYCSKPLSHEYNKPSTMMISPKQLGEVDDISSLCNLLRHSSFNGVSEDTAYYLINTKKHKPKLQSPPNADAFIQKISKLNSMDEIEEISICGSEFTQSKDKGYIRLYRYNRGTKEYSLIQVFREENVEESEGRGGGCLFNDDRSAKVFCFDQYPVSFIKRELVKKFGNELAIADNALKELYPSAINDFESLAVFKNNDLLATIILITDENELKYKKELKKAFKSKGIKLLSVYPDYADAIKDLISVLEKIRNEHLDAFYLQILRDAIDDPLYSKKIVAAKEDCKGRCIKVKFLKGTYSYNCFDEISVGDIVYVDGSKKGEPGIVIQIIGDPRPGFMCVKQIIRRDQKGLERR